MADTAVDTTNEVAEVVGDVKVTDETSGNEPEVVAPGQEDEFSYINENGFTSEIFKVEIRGMPKYYGVGVGGE